MKTTRGAIRRGGVALVTLGLAVAMSGAFTVGAQAKPDKEPDTTLNDHPSGKDKTQEAGGSSTQGNSPSDPDGDTNGGADKPGGTGGFDADKDGNNGCGNDDDFEDDNNGNCGGRRVRGANRATTDDKTTTKSTTSDSTTTTNDSTTTTTDSTTTTQDETVTLNGVVTDRESREARVLGITLVRDEAGSITGAAPADDGTAVLGTSFVRSTATGTGSAGATAGGLAATGVPILLWALFGLAMVAAGGLALKVGD